MELGISSLGHIIESGRTKRDNYSEMIDLLIDATRECLKFSEENKFKVCELIVDPPDIFTKEKRQKFIDVCNSFSIKKQVHGPFIDMGMCSHNDKISQASVESYIETAEICQEIEAHILVIHPGVANFLINSIKNYNTNQLIKAVDKLLNTVADLDVIVCMENMPKKALMLLKEKEIENFFSAVNRNDLFFCYDTSHGWTNDLDVSYLWEKLHKIIKNIHLVDNFDKEKDSHPALGTGKINFDEIFKIVNEYNYKGSLIVELSSAKDLPKSIEFIQKFL